MRSITLKDKRQIVLNSDIELGEQEGNGKGRYFMSRFIEPGIAHYEELGDILITKETLNKFIQTMVGVPVIIDHEDVTDKNVDKLRVGTVSKVWFNEFDGYFYCEGILTDKDAVDLVKNKGWNVSCAYSFVADETKKQHNGKDIDMEFTDGEFLHLAIVEDPRYEGANIVVNKKDDDLEWITVKGNHIPIKKGQTKDEAVKEFLEGKKESGSKDYKTGDKITFDTNWRGVNEKIKEGTIIGKEKKLGIKGDPNPDYQYKVKTDDGKTILVEKEAIKESKDKPGDSGEKGDFNKGEKVKADTNWRGINPSYVEGEIIDKRKILAGRGDANPEYEYLIKSKDGKERWVHKNGIESKQDKKETSGDSTKNSIGDITMTVLNDLTDFIKKVVKNEKEDEMTKVKNEDKRKLIDEIGGILKDKVDDEIIRTVIKKCEELSYEPSEDDKADNKAKNVEEEKEEAKNKCKNEEDKKEDKKADNEDDEEEDEDATKNEDDDEDKAENKKVKNSMKDIVMGGKGQVQEQKLYISRKERLEEGNKY